LGELPETVAEKLNLPLDEVKDNFLAWKKRETEREFNAKKLIGHPVEKARLLSKAMLASNISRLRTDLWIHEAFRGGTTPEEGGGMTKLYEPLTASKGDDGGKLVSHFYNGYSGDVRVTMPRDVAALDVVRAAKNDPQFGYNIVDIDPFGSLMMAHAIFGGAFRLMHGEGGILFATLCTGTNHLRNSKIAAAVAGFYGTERPEPGDQMQFIEDAAEKAGRELDILDYVEMSRCTFRAVYHVKPAVLPPVELKKAVKRLATLLGA
jgi:hypothetical protein